MRQASLDDIARAFERSVAQSGQSFVRLEVSALDGFNDFEVEINQPMVAVCGATGMGKSTILEMVRLIGQEDPSEVYGDGISRFAGASATLALKRNGHSSTHRLTTSGSNPTHFDCEFIDLDGRTSSIQDLFRTVDVASLSEGIELSQFDKKLTQLCAFICGKEYISISFREIEIDDRIFPLFTVELPNRGYDSRTCSHGELSILYVAWSLFYSDQKVFLIEEPEAFLPPVAQGRIFYLLASSIVRHGHLIMFSTHAASLIEYMPETALLPIKSVGQSSRVLKESTAKNRILTRLGLHPKRICIIYVEDALAAIVTNELIRRSDLSTICQFEIRPHTESSGGIKKFADGLDQTFTSVCMIGILDGDMRDAADSWKHKERLLFLPFEKSMEEEFLHAIAADIPNFAKAIGRTEEQIEDCLDAATGGDIHQRFQKAADELALPLEAFSIIAFKHWISDIANQEKAETFISSVKLVATKLPHK